jgi:hypothetical protein
MREPLITNWREVALREATTPAEWQEAGPGNGWHAGPRWRSHAEDQRVYKAAIDAGAGDCDYQVYITGDGEIRASYWVHIQKGPENPWGRGCGVAHDGTVLTNADKWSWITPEAAREAALVALAEEAENMMVEALADGSVASQKAARTMRAWVDMEAGRAIPWRRSWDEMSQAAEERRVWLRARRAECSRPGPVVEQDGADEDGDEDEELDPSMPCVGQGSLF